MSFFTKSISFFSLLLISCGSVSFAQSYSGCKFKLVSSQSELEAGKKYVVAYYSTDSSESSYAMSTSVNSNYINSTKVDISNNILTASESTLVLSLGGEDGNWTLCGENYSGSNTYLSFGKASSAYITMVKESSAAKCTFAFTEDSSNPNISYVKIKNTTDASSVKRYIQLQANFSNFRYPTGDQLDCCLFKLIEEDKKPGSVISNFIPNADGKVFVHPGRMATFSSENALALSISINGESYNEYSSPYSILIEDPTIVDIIPIDASGNEVPECGLNITFEILQSSPIETDITYDFTSSDYGNRIGSVDWNHIYHDIITGFDFMIKSAIGSIYYEDSTGWITNADNGEAASSIKFGYKENGPVMKVKSAQLEGNVSDWDVMESFDDAGFISGLDITANKSFSIKKAHITIEHEKVYYPRVIVNPIDNLKVSFSHQERDHKIYYRIYTGNPAEKGERIAANDPLESGFQEFNEEITMKPGEKLDYFAQHPMGLTSGILSLTADADKGISTIVKNIPIEILEESPIYYNLQGFRILSPQKGLYIRVLNGKSEKVIL